MQIYLEETRQLALSISHSDPQNLLLCNEGSVNLNYDKGYNNEIKEHEYASVSSNPNAKFYLIKYRFCAT